MAEIWVALIKNNLVQNTVVVDSLESASELFQGYEIVEINENTGLCSVGDELYNSKFRSAKPTPASIWDEEGNFWYILPE